MLDEGTRKLVIRVVLAVWAGNFIAGLAVPGYQSSESINGIFMAVVGGAYALGVRDKSDKSGGRHRGEEDD